MGSVIAFGIGLAISLTLTFNRGLLVRLVNSGLNEGQRRQLWDDKISRRWFLLVLLAADVIGVIGFVGSLTRVLT